MELEVGMYVRTDNGDITKISSIWENERVFFENKVDIGYLSSDSFGIGFLNKCKASHTLLGDSEEPCLIEVGDYVNGSKVQEIGEGYVEIEEYSGLNNDMPCVVKTEDIESIVTKEQFSQMEYKVGE